MGNCIGRKSGAQNKHSPSIISTAELHCNNQLATLQTRPLSSLEQPNALVCHLSDVKQLDILIDKDEKNVVQHPSSSSPVRNKKFQSVICPVILITNEQDITMGHLCSKDNDQEIISESLDTLPSPSLSDSSLSSFSCNTTSFSSQDQLILSSSSSSSSQHKFYSEQIYLSTILPASFSRCNNDLFLNEFHQNTISYHYQTLKSLIDDVVQQQSVRIHRHTKTVFFEHKQFQCVHLKDLRTFDTPALIFDDDQKLVYITKYTRYNELQSITYATKDRSRIFSSCDHCSLLLSGSKLNNHLRPFFLVNITYNLVQLCFNEINNTNIFGYISRLDRNQIRQTIINNSKLTYSYDLDVDHTDFYFVLRLHSWPQVIRSSYEQRQRLWPLTIENLFANTCFIRFNGNERETFITDQCSTCEKKLSSSIDSSWSYTYVAIEAQFILNMSDGHIRFASIVWNYLNSKTHGEFPFTIFKHTLFYFFEKYSSNTFTTTTSDLLSQVHFFLDFLFNHYQMKSIPHYFNSNYNLYNEKISMTLLSIKLTYLDLKNSSIYLLPKSSLYLYHLIYLIQFQSNFLQDLYSSKTNLIQTILDTHELVIKQLSLGIQTYRQQLDSSQVIKSYRTLTLDCLYRYQEENVQIILDYLPFLREKEPSLLIHSFWSIFIQYFNCLFNDLFIS